MIVCYDDCLLYDCPPYNCLLWLVPAMMIVCCDDCLLYMMMIVCYMIVCYDYDCLLYDCLLYDCLLYNCLLWWVSVMMMIVRYNDLVCYDDCRAMTGVWYDDCLIWGWLSAMMMSVCYDDDSLLWWLSACEFVGCIPSASPLLLSRKTSEQSRPADPTNERRDLWHHSPLIGRGLCKRPNSLSYSVLLFKYLPKLCFRFQWYPSLGRIILYINLIL